MFCCFQQRVFVVKLVSRAKEEKKKKNWLVIFNYSISQYMIGTKIMQKTKTKGTCLFIFVASGVLVSVSDLFSFCLCTKWCSDRTFLLGYTSSHSILQAEIMEHNPKHQNKTRNNSIATQKKTDSFCSYSQKPKFSKAWSLD